MRASRAIAWTAVLAAIPLLTGCFFGDGSQLRPNPPSATPPAATPPPATSDTLASPLDAAAMAKLPFTDSFDDPALPGWYPIGRGVVKRTADGKMLLEETQGSLGFTVLSEAIFPDRIVIEFDCQALRFAGHPSLVFSATRDGASFAADPAISDPIVDAEIMTQRGMQYYMLGWHTGWRAADFPQRVAKALLQKNPGGKQLAAVDNALVAPAQKTHHFRIVKDGDRIVVEVDGQRRITVIDPKPLGPGHIGFRIRADRTGSFRCLIDNLKITPLLP